MKFCKVGRIVLLFSSLLLASCKEDTPNEPDTPDVDQFISKSNSSLNSGVTYLQAATLSYSVAQFIPGLGKVAADTLLGQFLTCPYVILDRGTTSVKLDYGTGCQGSDGKTRSGSIQFVYSGRIKTSGSLAITLNNFQSGGQSYSGNLTVTVSNSTIQLAISNGTVSGSQGSRTITGNLTIQAELNNLTTPNDDVYLLSGSLSVTDADNNTLTYAITEPLRFAMDCSYPIQGKMTVSGESSLTATVDFYPKDGACDDIISVKVLGITQEVHLGG